MGNARTFHVGIAVKTTAIASFGVAVAVVLMCAGAPVESAASGVASAGMRFETASTYTATVYLPAVFAASSTYSWSQVGFPASEARDVLVDRYQPGLAIACISFDGAYITEDGGQTWTLAESFPCSDLASHPVSPTVRYMAGRETNAGVQWSTDSGRTWMPVPGATMLPNLMVSVAVHPSRPNTILAGAGYFEPVGGRIWLSADGGSVWTPVSGEFFSVQAFAFDPVSPTIILAGTQSRGVYKSSTGGNWGSWAPANTGLPSGGVGLRVHSLLFDPQVPARVYAATSQGIFASENDGESWAPLWEGVNARDLISIRRDMWTLLVGTGNGLFVSDDGGQQWFPLDGCGESLQVNRVAPDPFAPFTIWAATDAGLWKCSSP